VPFSTSANGNMDHTAGVYLNPQTVCLVGFGAEIVGGPSLEQQLGAGPGAYVPAGMTQTPQLPSGAAPAPAQPAPAGMPAPAPTPAPATAPSGMPAQAPATVGNGSGMPTQPTNTPSGETGSPTSYGGYMAPPATGGGMPGA